MFFVAASGFESSNFDLSWSGKESSSNQDETKNDYGFYYEKNLTEVVEDSYGMELVRDIVQNLSSFGGIARDVPSRLQF